MWSVRQTSRSTRVAERRKRAGKAIATRISGHPEPNRHITAATPIAAKPSMTALPEHYHTDIVMMSSCR